MREREREFDNPGQLIMLPLSPSLSLSLGGRFGIEVMFGIEGWEFAIRVYGYCGESFRLVTVIELGG